MSNNEVSSGPDSVPGGMGQGEPSRDRPNDSGEDDIDILDVLLVLAKYKKHIVVAPIVFGVLTFFATYLFPNVYTSTARIMPPQQQNQSSSMALLGQLSSLAGLAGLSTGSIKNPSDLYVGLLKSQTVADTIIGKFSLRDVYSSWRLINLRQYTLVETRDELSNRADISAGTTDGIISIEISDRDPDRAANIANTFVEELDKLTRTLAITDGRRRRRFYEAQVKDARDQLSLAEVELKDVQEKTGLIKPEDQGQAIIQAVATARAQIAVKEVQLSAMRMSVTEQNPEYRRAQEELIALRRELSKVEKAQKDLDPGILVPTKSIPEVGLEYVRKLREVKYREGVFQLLAQQLELARLDEARETPLIDVLDRAVPPDYQTQPKRALIAVLGALLIAALTILWAFARESFQRSNDRERADKLAALRRYSYWDRMIAWFRR